MMLGLAVLTTVAVTFAAEPAGEVVGTGRSASLQSADVECVVSAWRRRESVFATGEIQWRVRRDGLALFGGSAVVSGSGSDDESIERLLMNGARYRFDGLRTAQISIGAPAVHLSPAEERRRFRILLSQGRLPKWTDPEPVFRFTQWGLGGRRTRVWQANGEEYPRAIIEQLGSEHGNESTGGQRPARRVEDLLLDAILLSLRPASLGPLAHPTEHRQFRQPGAVDEIPCVILEERLDSIGDTARTRQFWLDPENDFAILRVVECANGSPRTQADVRYTPEPHGIAMPAHWVAMTLDHEEDVTSYIYADRTQISYDVPNVEQRFQIDLPPATWVVDRVSRQSYLLHEDGRRLMLNGKERVPGVRYEDLLARRSTSLLSWRAGLLALMCIVGLVCGLQRIVHARRSSGRLNSD